MLIDVRIVLSLKYDRIDYDVAPVVAMANASEFGRTGQILATENAW